MKAFLSTILFVAASLSCHAETIGQFFVNIPDSLLLPTLTKVNREDCIDFLASNMKAVVKNRFEGKSEMTILTSDYLQMQVSTSMTIDLKLLALTDTTSCLCLVRTYCIDSLRRESTISFFTTDWLPLPLTQFLSSSALSLVHRPWTSLMMSTDDRSLRLRTYDEVNDNYSESVIQL